MPSELCLIMYNSRFVIMTKEMNQKWLLSTGFSKKQATKQSHELDSAESDKEDCDTDCSMHAVQS